MYQNVHAQIGKDSYEYSEAWSLNTTKSQQDLFSIPPGPLRESTYECHADTWIEEGGIDPAQRLAKVPAQTAVPADPTVRRPYTQDRR